MFLLVILLAVIFLLAIPVNLSYQLSIHEMTQYHLNLIWLFGLVQFRFPLRPLENSQANKTAFQKKTKNNIFSTKERALNGGKKHSPQSKINPLSIIRMKACRQRMIRFSGDLWRAIEKRDFRLFIRIGLEDPADTGRLWALFGPLSGLVSNIEVATIQIKPEFAEPVFQLNTSGEIRVVPLRLLSLIFGVFLSPSLWRGLKQLHRH